MKPRTILSLAVAVLVCGTATAGELALLECKHRTPQFPLKTKRMITTDAQIATARQNAKDYPAAKKVADGIVAAAEVWAAWSDADLRAMIPTADVPRAFNVGTAGCPTCGKAIYEKGGTYPWNLDPKQPFKVTCPICGGVFPDNDYAAWYRSGFTERAHLAGDYADDGWGWLGPDGERYWFVGYANHWVWQKYRKAAVKYMAQAYLLTGDAVYAHKAALMLDRIAEVYPAMDYHGQSRYGQLQGARGGRYEGKIVNLIWETGTLTDLAFAYDSVWETIDGDAELAALTGKTGEEIRANIEANLLEEGIDGVFAQKIRGNFGMHQRALVYAGLARQYGQQDEWFDGLLTRTGGASLFTGLNYALYNLVYRDGVPYETSPGYNFSWVANITTVAEALRLADIDVYAIPKTKRLYDGVLDVVNAGRFTPALGDSGNVYGGRVGNNAQVFQAAYRAFEGPRYLRHLTGFGAAGEGGFAGFNTLLHPPIEDKAATATGSTGDVLPSRVMDGYGLAILNNPGDTRSISMYYGYKGGHGHYDRLHFDIIANGHPMTPDTGYPDFMNAYVPGIFTWSKNTIAHNTVTVDAARQPGNVPGTVRLFANGVFARVIDVEANGTYPQCGTYRRLLIMIDIDDTRSYFVDLFLVEGGGQHDYSLHGPPGTFTCDGGQWSEPAPGTLAGEDVPVGKIYDNAKMAADGYTGSYAHYGGSGFQHLSNVQRHQGGAWVAEWEHEKDPAAKLRIRVLDQPGQEILLADAQVSPVKHKQLLKYLIARRAGSDLKSTFMSVLEPFSENSFIDRVSVLQDFEQGGRALEVQFRDGRKDLVIVNPSGALQHCAHADAETNAIVAVASDRSLFAARPGRLEGTGLLRCPDAPPFEGKVVAVDPQKAEVRVRGVAVGELRKDVAPIFSNGRRQTTHRIKEMRAEGEDIVFVMEDDLLVGRARITALGEAEITTDTAFMFAPVYRGAYVADAKFQHFYDLDTVEAGRLKLCAPLPVEHPFSVGEDAWIVNVGPGDMVELPAVYEAIATESR